MGPTRNVCTVQCTVELLCLSWLWYQSSALAAVEYAFGIWTFLAYGFYYRILVNGFFSFSTDTFVGAMRKRATSPNGMYFRFSMFNVIWCYLHISLLSSRFLIDRSFFYFSDICVSNANNSCIFKTFVCQVIRDCDDSLASIFPSNKCAMRMRLIECTWNLQGTAIKVN